MSTLKKLEERVDFVALRKLSESNKRKFHNNFNQYFSLTPILTTENDSKCGRKPLLMELNIENNYWQVLETSNGTFKMFNAYYDNRSSHKVQSVIRILAFINRVNPIVRTHCQIWFDGVDEPIIRAAKYSVIWVKDWGYNKIGSQPYLISCGNPLQSRIPLSVSLVEDRCEFATNHFQVINNLPEGGKKKPFAVCVKDLDFMDDQSMMVTEWIEILSLLGAHKIFVYVIKINPNLMKTLKYYEKKGKVKVEMISEPEGLPKRAESLTQWLQNELISLNDCLYKHMYEYDFLVPLDIDEIILPTRTEDKTWMDLMMRTAARGKMHKTDSFSAYSAHNVFFLTDNNHKNEIQLEVPTNMHFLQHIYRAANFSGPGIGSKSFQNTERVLKMDNHFPMEVIGQEFIDYFFIDKSDGQLQHYRRDCENYPADECAGFKSNTVKDLTLWKYKNQLIFKVNESLEALKSFDDLQ